MKQSRTLIYNTILLTATSVLMRIIGLLFQVFLSGKIGSAGIGLFQLIMSVGIFAQTVAISGIRFTTTRLVSEELGKGNIGGVRKTVRSCLMYAAFTGFAASLILFQMSNYLGTGIIGDERTVLSLKLLSMSLPWMAIGTVFAGYFTAVCRVIKSAVVQLFEQLVRIVTVILALQIARHGDLEQMCAAVIAGGIAGETFSFLLILVIYLFDKRRYRGYKVQGDKIPSRVFSIAVPLALSAYARTALTAAENILIPRGFRKSGVSSEEALSSYGIIQGMVFPIITFPSAFFASLSELIVPELTEAQVRGKTEYISVTSTRLLRLCLIFSICVMAVLTEFSDELGTVIYKDPEVGAMIKIFAVLMPIMYLDTVTDGMLRGLGQHMYSMYFNILDSLLCLVLVANVLPKYAVPGYIAILYISEIFNFTLSIGRLMQITKIRFKLGVITKSLLSAFGGVSAARVCVHWIKIPFASVIGLIVSVVISAVVYIILLFLFNTLSEDDIAWIRRIFRRRENAKKQEGH